MCLAIPGKVVSVEPSNGMRVGRVDFGGAVRVVSLEFVPEAEVGDYVMVHVGFAIRRIDAEEAERTYKLLDEIDAIVKEMPPESSG